MAATGVSWAVGGGSAECSRPSWVPLPPPRCPQCPQEDLRTAGEKEIQGPYILPWDQLALWIPELSSALASRGARKRKMQK